MKNEMFLEILERSQHIGDALTTMLYAVEAMKNVDNGEKELREIGWNIESQIGFLQEYQAETQRILEQLKSEQRERAEPAEIQGKMLTREEAKDLFKKNAMMINKNDDVVPFYRAIEIFGEEAAVFLADNLLHSTCYIEYGSDAGGCGKDLHYLYESGFLQVALNHNILLQEKVYAKSESGRLWRKLWKEEIKRREEKEKEEKRKAAERKAKREARAAEKAAKKEGDEVKGE